MSGNCPLGEGAYNEDEVDEAGLLFCSPRGTDTAPLEPLESLEPLEPLLRAFPVGVEALLCCCVVRCTMGGGKMGAKYLNISGGVSWSATLTMTCAMRSLKVLLPFL